MTDQAVGAGGRPTRRRLTRGERLRQLLDVAWKLVGEEGSDALTLGRLAELAGVTKPVVYDHFATRPALLAALYQDFDQRQTALMDAAVEACAPTLLGKASVIAGAYVDCVIRQGREIPGVVAALGSTPELQATKREYEAVFLEKCRGWLSPYAQGGAIGRASLLSLLGAAEALSGAAARDEISAQEAKDELVAVIVFIVSRGGRD